MKKILLTCCFILLSCSLAACADNRQEQPKSSIQPVQVVENNSYTAANTAQKIVLTVNGQQTVVRLYDSAAARDLLSMLPLTLTFKEYAASEKIAYLPRKLDTRGMDNDSDNTGDFNYFAPWGNLAIFYKDKAQEGGGLIVLGSIESGKELLNNLNTDFTITIKKLE